MPRFPDGALRQADPARLGKGLQPRGDIDTVAEDVAFVDHDVAEMNADAEFDPSIVRPVGVLLGQALLDFDGAAYRIDGARKLHQEPAPVP